MPSLKQISPRFRIGEGIERHNLTIFPLFAEDAVEPARYVTVGHALRSGSARITEVSEGGSVPTLALENLEDIPVLIIDGQEILGAKQNRIANLTVLAPGKHTLPLPVSCVERGRWSYRSREFSESPDIAFSVARANKSRRVSQNLSMHGSRVSDQSEVWNDIDALSCKLGYNSPTSAMQDVFETRRNTLDDYLREVSVADEQVGAVFAINGRAAGAEMFDSTETFKDYMPRILRSYALDALANRSPSTVSAEASEARTLLDSILELDAKAFPALGLGEDIRLESLDITGGALVQDGKIIHLVAFRTTLPQPTLGPGAAPTSDSVRPLVVRQGHLLIRGGNGRLALLDTGSPVSIGRGAEYRIAGQSLNPSTAMQSVLDNASEHLGRRVEWLFGHGFFASNTVLIDWPGHHVRLLRDDDPIPHGVAVPIELVMGVPVVTGQSRDRSVRAVIDSGASLSYVPEAVVRGHAPVGRRKDFYPGFGEFETDTWRVSVAIGGRTMRITAGVLPSMLQMMFGMILGADGWIIGSDFFRNRAIVVDYRGNRLIDITDPPRQNA